MKSQAALVLLSLCSFYAQAQTIRQFSPTDYQVPAIYEPGAPLGSYAISPLESINLFNGSLSLTLPLRQINGRGEASYGITIPITRYSWTVQVNEVPVGTSQYRYDSAAEFEWLHPFKVKFGPGLLLQKHMGSEIEDCGVAGSPSLKYSRTYSHLIFLQPDGSELQLYGDVANSVLHTGNGILSGSCAGGNSAPYRVRGPVFRSRDANPVVFVADSPFVDNDSPTEYRPPFDANLGPSGTLRFPNGTSYQIFYGRVIWILDRNGNKLTFCYLSDCTAPTSANTDVHPLLVVDSLGRSTAFFYDELSGPPNSTTRTDRITYIGSEAANPRQIKVEHMPYRSRLISSAEDALPFPELGIANSNSNFQVVSKVILPDGRQYEFFYNRYAEVVKVLLPTGGRIEYDYAAGLVNSNPTTLLGVLPSGQVLTDDPTVYGNSQTSFHRPYIYRRLVERRAYLNGGDINPIRQTTYSRPETATGETRPAQVTTAVQIAASNFVEVTEYSRNTASQNAAAKVQVRRHYFFGQDALGQPTYFGAAARLGAVNPPGTGSMAGYPNPYEAKEYRSQILNPADNTTVLSQQDESWTVTPGGRAYACNAQSTLRNGADTLKARTATLRDDYYNQTHVYEFAYGAGPEIGGPIGCWIGLAGHYRATTSVYWTSPYDSATGPYMPSLISSQTTSNAAGTEIAKSTVVYDQYEAESNPPDGVESRTAPLVPLNGLSGNQTVYPPTYKTRGNPTTISSLIKALPTYEAQDRWTTRSRQYDVAGNVVKDLDALRNPTSIEYNASYSHAFPTKITNALGQFTTATYDLNIGRPITLTDSNQVSTSFSYIDPLDRLKSIVRAGAETAFDYLYTAASATTTVRKSTKVLSSSYQRNDQVFDGLGRGVISRTSKDGAFCDSTGTNCLISFKVLDGLDREVEAYNPTDGVIPTSCATSPCTKTEYDGLGRITKKISPDNLQSTLSYAIVSGASPVLRTTTTDPAQVQSAADRDAFGRIVNAIEYPASGGPWTTAYEYDLLNNLTKVTQAAQQRNFKYDSLSRLREAENPETGKISFAYDDNGNLKEKKDGRSSSLNALIIDYDKLNRILKKSYPSTSAVSPDVHFTYDSDQRQPGDTVTNHPIGQLVRVRVGSPSTETNQTTFHRFDSLGRVEQATQRVDSKQYLTTYSYDFANQLRTLGYPKGWSLTYDYNSLGQLTSVSKGATVYASQMQYHPHGAPKQMTLGNGLISKWDFNTRLQLTKTQLGTTAIANSVAEFGLTYDGTTCNGGPNWVNNGNVVKQDIVVGGVTFTQTFGYDKLNRLSCVKEGSLTTPTWKQEFEYDPYGNRWIPPGGNTLPYTESITATVAADFDTNTNRLITQPIGGLANYDGAGNLKRLAGGAGASGPGTHDLSYDGENRIYESNRFGAITGYVYDGFGRRVKRTGTVPAYFAYDVSGNLLMEDSADVESTGVSYVTQDHLGSTRVVTDKDRNVVRRYDYAPFGEDLKLAGGRTVAQNYSGSDAELKEKVRFTGKERDAETGLDYFGARYMSAAQARFTSPDAPFADQHPEDPQSWNLYAYGRNNPLLFVDHDGRAATVTIETDEKKKTGTITVSASIAVYATTGSGLTAQQTQAAASAIQTGINNAWSGTYTKDGITYTVNTNVSVQVVANEKAGATAGAQNVIGLTNGDAIPGRADSFVSPAGLWASLTGGADTGTWNVQNLGKGIAAHEYTHLMGVDDKPGNVLSNTAILNNPQIPRSATAIDYGLAFGGAVDSHRSASRSFSLSPFGYSAPQSSKSTTTVRAPSRFGSWR